MFSPAELLRRELPYNPVSEDYCSAKNRLRVPVLIISIVGGITSISGTVAAGLLLGLIITLANAFIGAYIAQLVLHSFAVGALPIKPEQIA